MDPIFIILLLVAAGIVLLLGELLLPTHGVLGVAGLLSLGGALVVIFLINRWLGLALFVGALLASPFLMEMAMRVWTKTYVGRRIVLQPVDTPRAPSPVSVGQVGTAVSELRPMGECDFGDHRIEAIAELGMIDPGRKVRVVALNPNGRPTVRMIES